jgi:uncharacterized integral membrane protein (TIGR00697 family)
MKSMSNIALFFVSAFIDILFVLFASRRGLEWLFGTIIVNLILVGIFGSKIISVVGLTTNAGNVFYACVFLATHFLLENHGRRSGLKAIWYGASFMLFFMAMSQLSAQFIATAGGETANAAMLALFSPSVRLISASILGYVFAQSVNIFLYQWIGARYRGRHLWLRSNAANIVGQLVDSLLFFTIAFFDAPGPLLVQMIIGGWVVKTFVVMLGTPFLYIDSYFE